MRLLKYQYKEKNTGGLWNVSEFSLGTINLIGGLSGVGKTRIINTLFNLSQMIKKGKALSDGEWKLNFIIGDKEYEYILHLSNTKPYKEVTIKKEVLKCGYKILIKRSRSKFIFLGGSLPEISSNDLGIYLFRENKKIKPIYDGFCNVYIRRMNPDYFAIFEKMSHLGVTTKKVLSKPKKDFTLEYIQENFKDISTQLFFLRKYHPHTYNLIKNDFKEIFPFVLESDVRPITEIKNLKIKMPPLPLDALTPLLLVKEKNVKNKIPILALSSGMIRAFIQLIDLYTMPKGGIYLIDEFENSMGIKSLPVMLDILMNNKSDIQLIFTTHHPYIFNNVNIKYWKILKRKGGNVKILNGDKLKEKFSKSRQDDYTQLINTEFENGI